MSDRPVFNVNNIDLPTPGENGFSYTAQKIWSSNAGRNTATGDFSGDLIAKKYTVKLTYSSLTEAEYSVLWSLADSMTPFLSCKFPMHPNKAMAYYMADPTFTLRRRDAHMGEYVYDGVQVEFIQK